MNNPPNPYVGPRSFTANDKKKFHGRDREIRQLTSLLIAERLVLIHSPSGAGKSSLIQAGLLPEMEQEDFYVLPVIRVNVEPTGIFGDKQVNRYLYSALVSLEEKVDKEKRLPDETLARLSLDQYLKQRYRPEEAPPCELLIFDQFEETLTMAPNDREGKLAFFKQVGEALSDLNRWALFAIREDYLGALEPYLRFLPNRLACHFRLDLLDRQAALQAMRQPANEVGVDFLEDAAVQLFEDLAKIQVQLPDGSFEKQDGLHVEPVQLQVVCYNLWQSLAEGDININKADLTGVGNVDQSLADYYEQSVKKAVTGSDATERDVRDWFENKLIRQGDIRGQVPRGPLKSDGLSNKAIDLLINSHVVRSEKRGVISWYELSHDRMIKPIHQNNALWYSTNLKPFQLIAARWIHAGRPEELLMRGTELAQAEQDAREVAAIVVDDEKAFVQASKSAWQKENLPLFQRQTELWIASGRPESLLLRGRELAQAEKEAGEISLTEAERAYLEASRAAQAQDQLEKHRNLLIRRLAIAALLALVIAVVLGVNAIFSANTNRDLAEKNASIAQTAAAAAAQAQASAALASTAEAISKIEAQNARDAQATAEAEKLRADNEAMLALARQLAARSQLFSTTRTEDAMLGTLLAIEAGKRYPGFEANQALQNFINTRATSGGTELPIVVHDGAVRAVAISPDARLVASAGDDQTVRVWEITSGQEVLATLAHNEPVSAVAFSPNGQLLVSGSEDGVNQVWDLATGRLFLSVANTAPITTFAFSPDGQRVLSADVSGMALLWDVWSGSILGTLQHRDLITSVAFSPDGRWAATGSLDGTTQVLDLTTNNLIRLPNDSPVMALAFSPDGQWLVTGSQDGTTRLWFAGDETFLSSIQHNSPVTVLAIAPAAQAVIVGYEDGTLRAWNPTSMEEAILFQRDAAIIALAISPDGSWLATGDSVGYAAAWDLATGVEITHIQHDDYVTSISISPDGQWVVSGSGDGTARVWKAIAGNNGTQTGHSGYISAVAFSPDGLQAASGSYDATVRIWEAASGLEEKLIELDSYVTVLAYSPDGRWLAAGSGSGRVSLWDTSSWEETTPIQYLYTVISLAFSADSRYLVSGSYDQTAQIWDAVTNQVIATLQSSSYISAVAFSPDGKWVITGSGEGAAGVWELASQRRITELALSSPVYKVAFSQDGKWVATGSEDGTVRIWDTANWQQTTSVQYTGPIMAIAFDQTSQRIVSASLDGTVQVWEVLTGKILASVQHGSPVYVASFSLDGSKVLSGSEDGAARVWDAATGNAIAQIQFSSAVSAAAISPDGELALSGTEEGNFLIWHVGTDELVQVACERVTRNLTLDEWRQYIGDEAYQPTCPTLPPGN